MLRKPGPATSTAAMPSAASSRVRDQLGERPRVGAGLLGQLQRDVGRVVAVPLLPRPLDRHRAGHAVRQGHAPSLGQGPSARRRWRSESCSGVTGQAYRRAAAASHPFPVVVTAWSAGGAASVSRLGAGRVRTHPSPRSSGDRAPPSGGGSVGSNPTGGTHLRPALTCGFAVRPVPCQVDYFGFGQHWGNTRATAFRRQRPSAAVPDRPHGPARGTVPADCGCRARSRASATSSRRFSNRWP